jgi:hypothetical protein
MSFNRYKSDVILVAHFFLGILTGVFPSGVFIWVMAAFAIGLYTAFTKSIRYPEYTFAAYLVGIELLGRMSASGIPHEFIKYAVSSILMVSMMVKPKPYTSYPFIVFMLLFLPGLLLTDGGGLEENRQLISANLSGPFCLAISALYFYNKPFDMVSLRALFRALLFPLAAILGFMVINTPDLSQIEFGFDSNFATSIYGPNQMSSILGLGILIIGLGYFLKIRLFGSYLLALAFLSFLLFRGLLTFSRGGMITPVILFAVVFIYFTWKVAGFNANTVRMIFFAAIFSGLAIFLFQYTDELTGNKLSDRYKGVKRGKQIDDIDKLTSGRTMIMYLDWEIFQDNPVLGVGAGMAKVLRKKYGYSVEVAAHNEFSRILAEHGVFGIGALLIMFFMPLKRLFSSRKILEQIIVIAFIGFCFVFMTHAATRIAAPCFLYGFAFVSIVPSLKWIKQNGSLLRQYSFKTREVFNNSGNIGSTIG